MLHTGRVGSTVVANMLEQHPGLRWDGEVFEKLLQRRRAHAQNGGAILRKRDRLPPLLDLRARVGAAHRDRLCYGFETKHHYDQHGYVYGLRVGAYVERLSRMGFDRFIEVRRENYLRQLVSVVRLRQTGTSHIQAGTHVERQPLIIDLHSTPLSRARYPMLGRFAELDELHEETLEALQDRNALYLTYERDIEQDPAYAYAQVCKFLGLDPVPSVIALQRTNDAPLNELIANFSEVADELAGTKYEWMLEGGR